MYPVFHLVRRLPEGLVSVWVHLKCPQNRHGLNACWTLRTKRWGDFPWRAQLIMIGENTNSGLLLLGGSTEVEHASVILAFWSDTSVLLTLGLDENQLNLDAL